MVHMNALKILTISIGLSILIPNAGYCEEQKSLTLEEVRESFPNLGKSKKEILTNFLNDHPHQGCPINSSCSEQMGKKRLNWLKIISNPNQDSLSEKVLISTWIVPLNTSTPML